MKKIPNKQKGFTLLETLVAIFILLLALSSLFTVTSNNYFSSRYAKNELTAIYLAQEAIDYIRNDRDTTAFQGVHDWNVFLSHYGDPNTGTLCYSTDGCTIDATNLTITPVPNTVVNACAPLCRIFIKNENSIPGSYYTYTAGPNQTPTSIKRRIKMVLNNGSELQVVVDTEWLNGQLTRSTSLRTSLLQWQ